MEVLEMNVSHSIKNRITLVLIIFLVLGQFSGIRVYAAADSIQAELKDTVVLMVDSTKAYVKGIETRIDSSDPAATPVVKNGRTLVPLQFISDNFNLEVSWDSTASMAVITTGQTAARFKVGDNILSVNGKDVLLETAAEVMNGKLYIPLRALTENVMHKKVFYENGLIFIYSGEQNFSKEFISSVTVLFKDDTANTKPRKVTVGLSNEPYQMNTILKTDAISQTISNHINEGLTRYDRNSKSIPGIAERWEVSGDGLVWTFHLRDSRWSDGTPVTAQDFRFAFLEALSKEAHADYAFLFHVFKNAAEYNYGRAGRDEVGITVKDNKTLQLTLEAPTPYLPSLLAFGNFAPVKEDFYRKQKGTYGADAHKLLYSGPWIIKEWLHEDRLVLVKNPQYWNAENIKIDEIEFSIIKAGTSGSDMFLKNELDVINVTDSEAAAFESAGHEVKAYPDGSTFYLEFNTTDAILKNANIRKALTYAIDREDYIKNVRKDKSIPALSFTSPVIHGETQPFSVEIGAGTAVHTVTEAQVLLRKGIKELGLDSMPKISLLVNESEIAKRDGLAFAKYWKKNLGIEVEIIPLPFKTCIEKRQSRNFQIAVSGWGPDYNDPISFLEVLETVNGNNFTGYSSKIYDQLLRNIRNEKDSGKRMELLKKLEAVLLEDMPIGPIYHRYRAYAVKPSIQGLVRRWNQDIDLYWSSLSE